MKVAEAEKEFIVLCGILLALVSMLVFVIKAYISFKVKQEHCDGRFSAQDIRINHIGEKAESAEKKSIESINAIKEMKPKVDEMHKGFLEFIDDKYKKVKVQDA